MTLRTMAAPLSAHPSRRLLGAATAAALAWAAAATATLRYVAPSGSDAGACSAAAAPCRSLQYAVDHAAAGDEIRIAAGEYTGVLDHAAPTGYTPATVRQVVYVDRTLTLRGGFTTANWTTPNPTVYVTTIDAQGAGRCVFLSGTLDPEQTNTSPVLEGLRLTGGRATGLKGYLSSDAGGALFVWLAGATIRACTFTGNTASTATAGSGGGLAAYYAPVAITSCLFDGNVGSSAARGNGGGAFVLPGPTTTALTGNTFRNNSGGTAAGGGGGGAVYVTQLAATLSGNAVEGNTAATATGAIGWGGGIYSDNCTLTMRDNVIRNNRASADGAGGGGGGIYSGDGALDSTGDQVTGNTVTARAVDGAGRGGGLYAVSQVAGRTATVTLRNATISSNRGSASASSSAGSQGGGAYFNSVDAALTGCTLENNTGSVGGPAQGGGVYALDASVRCVGSVIRGNSAGVTTGAGGGIFVESPIKRPEAGLTLIDSLVASNTAGGTLPAQGGGIMVQRFSPVLLQGNRISGNTANGTGGGVALGGDILPDDRSVAATVPAVVVGNVISGNQSVIDAGAGLFAAWPSAGWGGLVIALNRIEGNTARTFGYATGGGVSLLWCPYSRVESNWVSGNTGGSAGGGIATSKGDHVVIEANTVRGNVGCASCEFPYAGGIYVGGNYIDVRRNLVAGNSAAPTPSSHSSGGGIGGNTGTAWNVVNNIIAGNTAGTAPGIDLYGNVKPFPYAPDLVTSGLVAHNTIADNGGGDEGILVRQTQGPVVLLASGAATGATQISVPTGAGWNVGDAVSLISPVTDWVTTGWESHAIASIKPGIGVVLDAPLQHAYAGGSLVSGTRLALVNNIIAGEAVGVAANEADIVVSGVNWFDLGQTVRNSVVLQGETYHYLVGVTGAVTGDPAFVGAGNGNYHVAAGSAAIDKGVPSGVAVDFDNQPRPVGAPDLGADEYGGTCTALRSVAIGGPATAAPGMPVTLTATSAPADASAVVDLRWIPEPTAGQGAASATYTFTAAGSPVVTVLARNCGGAVSASRAVGVGACGLACAASVPGGALPGASVAFSASASASGCADPVTYRWSFGDDTGSAGGASAGHVYAGIGRYRWTLTGTAGAVACSATGEIAIAARTVHLRRALPRAK